MAGRPEAPGDRRRAQFRSWGPFSPGAPPPYQAVLKAPGCAEALGLFWSWHRSRGKQRDERPPRNPDCPPPSHPHWSASHPSGTDKCFSPGHRLGAFWGRSCGFPRPPWRSGPCLTNLGDSRSTCPCADSELSRDSVGTRCPPPSRSGWSPSKGHSQPAVTALAVGPAGPSLRLPSRPCHPTAFPTCLGLRSHRVLFKHALPSTATCQRLPTPHVWIKFPAPLLVLRNLPIPLLISRPMDPGKGYARWQEAAWNQEGVRNHGFWGQRGLLRVCSATHSTTYCASLLTSVSLDFQMGRLLLMSLSGHTGVAVGAFPCGGSVKDLAYGW